MLNIFNTDYLMMAGNNNGQWADNNNLSTDSEKCYNVVLGHNSCQCISSCMAGKTHPLCM